VAISESRRHLSDVANLSWSKVAVLAQAEREVAYERANTPSKSQQNRGLVPAEIVAHAFKCVLRMIVRNGLIKTKRIEKLALVMMSRPIVDRLHSESHQSNRIIVQQDHQRRQNLPKAAM
jgi:hypothetical protein